MEDKNKVEQRYLTSNTDVLYCSDITVLGKNGYLALVLDAGSRLILGHCLTSQEPTSEHLIGMVEGVLSKRQLRPNITIFHSDRGSQYTSEGFQHFLQEANLVPSLAHPQSHGNQLSERLNRTLKRLIRGGLLKYLGKDKYEKARLSVLTDRVDFYCLEAIVTEAISCYCNKPHKGIDLLNATPFAADEALTLQPCDKIETCRNNNGPKALKTRESKANKLKLFAEKELLLIGSPQREDEFLSPETEALMQHTSRLTLGLARQNATIAAKITEQNRVLYEQNRALLRQNEELKGKIGFLVDEAETVKTEREIKEAKKCKRLNAVKQRQRDAISPEEFDVILGMVGGTPYKGARIRVALLIMYYTGLRVSNLLKLTVNHVEDLVVRGQITLAILKRGPTRHRVELSNRAKRTLEEALPDIGVLNRGKSPNDYFFTAVPTKRKAGSSITRELFNREINSILIQASERLGKFLRSHSFRATFITDLLESGASIYQVKDIVGHSSIASTSVYQRSFLSQKELKKILSSYDKAHREAYVGRVSKRKSQIVSKKLKR